MISLLEKFDGWLGKMMGDTTGPKCCYCGMPARGRVVCMGNDNQVIDNPYCNSHFSEVHKQTMHVLDMTFPGQARGDLVLIQRWTEDEIPPRLPQTEAELLSEGILKDQDDMVDGF